MILIKNCLTIATMDEQGNEYKNRDILIEDQKISRIEEDIHLTSDQLPKCEIIDGKNLLVTPGLVNTHHHMYQTLTRNLPGAQEAKLFDWLRYLYPIWAGVGEEAIYYSTLLATSELLKTGCTLTTDHMYLYPQDFSGDIPSMQFKAASESGIRFYPTRGSMTLGKSKGGLPPDNVVQNPGQVIDHSRKTIEEFHDADPFSMRRIILAPCSPFSVEESVMRETAELAREFQVKLHTHLAETEDENEFCLEKYGHRPLSLMKEWNWLGDDVFFAHGIWFNDEELNLLKETKTGVAHCPTSNMRLGSGIARIREMIDMDISVGLGVDGSASNDSSDMLGEVRNALLLQRVKYGSAGLTAREALRLATVGGSKLLGSGKTGQIKAGYAADLALWDMSHIQYAGSLSDPVAAIIFCGYRHETAFTIVNGKIVVKDGHSLFLDQEEVSEKVNFHAHKLLSALV